jgi:chorismate dehydratase
VLNNKIRVGAVNYLNTKPLIFGFEHGEMNTEIELLLEYPSKIAQLLINNQIDVGLVPVSIIPELKEYHIISDYCIGCDGEVGSVCLFSEVPLENIETILLDYQSRTSVALLKILVKKYWKIQPNLVSTSEDYRKDIKGTTAGLIIGDRALEQRQVSPYKYDLGLEWKKHTGLPFVFAAWISTRQLDETFLNDFNEANMTGLHDLEKVIAENPYPAFDLGKYYSSYIDYHLDDRKRTALDLFLKECKAMP